MPKKVKKSEEAEKKLGRPDSIEPEVLSRRYRDLKYFLESQWGRIGWELQRVRTPDKLREILRLVPRVEQWRPFQDQPTGCLLEDSGIEIEKRELDLLSQRHEDADGNVKKYYSEYHDAYGKAAAATTALMAAISQFGVASLLHRFFWVLFLTARELKVQTLTNETNRLKDALDRAREKKQELEKQLAPRRAWFARNEVVKFRKSTRYENSAINFAKAMAGLPDYAWLPSFRKCSKIPDKFDKATSYLLFEVVAMLVKKSKSADLEKLEASLRDELHKPDADRFVRGYAGQNWGYMKWAFADCKGMGYSRARLPYKIMGGLLHHIERPKSITEVELAKLNSWT
jgi:hypothetical protein